MKFGFGGIGGLVFWILYDVYAPDGENIHPRIDYLCRFTWLTSETYVSLMGDVSMAWFILMRASGLNKWSDDRLDDVANKNQPTRAADRFTATASWREDGELDGKASFYTAEPRFNEYRINEFWSITLKFPKVMSIEYSRDKTSRLYNELTIKRRNIAVLIDSLEVLLWHGPL